MNNQIAIASSSFLAAEAGADIARAGGNAVDAAIAAALVSMNTEPGVCSLGCGRIVTPGRSNSPAGAFCKMNITWKIGGRPVSRGGFRTSTNFSNGKSW